MVLSAGRKCVDEGGVCGRWGWSGVEGGRGGGGGERETHPYSCQYCSHRFSSLCFGQRFS